MKFKFLKVASVASVLAMSGFVNAAAITHYGYTLNNDTNIVSNGDLEWLQWTETGGESIAGFMINPLYNGWQLASNIQVASLFSDFGFLNTTNENQSIFGAIPYDSNGDNSAVDKMLELFGIMLSVNRQGYGTGDNAFERSFAIFGTDDDDDKGYNRIDIFSDYTVRGIEAGGVTRMYKDDVYIDSEYSILTAGLMLVRESELTKVSAPSTIAILALALMGLAARRFKKQS